MRLDLFGIIHFHIGLSSLIYINLEIESNIFWLICFEIDTILLSFRGFLMRLDLFVIIHFCIG